jgi:hypothetical protein
MKKMISSMLAALVLLVAAPVLAQGDAVEGIELLLKNANGKVVQKCVSQKDGSWSFTELEPGNYTVDVNAKTATKSRSNIQNNRLAAMKVKEKANRTKSSSDFRDTDSDGDGLEEISFTFNFNEVSYDVKSPRDAGSGMASGKRTHHPVTFVKEWGAATPQFKVSKSGGTVSGIVTWDLAMQKK